MKKRFARLASLVRTLPRLGLGNVAVVALYRLSLKTGLAKRLTTDRAIINGDILTATRLAPPPLAVDVEAIRNRGDALMAGKLIWFSTHEFNAGSPPDWFANPFSGKGAANTDLHWSDIPDFDPSLGDVKIIWEPSRFDWLCDLARAARVSGDIRYLSTGNLWLQSWLKANPPFRGHNWKCGQEASLRLMAVLHAAWLTGDLCQPSDALLSFVDVHLDRIRPSMAYAVAQDNNHGTSEAAALWVGGAFLAKFGKNDRIAKGKSLARLGRKRMIGRIKRLVMEDGSFAQNSVNYHRLFLDTLSLTVLLFQQIDPKQNPIAELPTLIRERLRLAVLWLNAMTADNGHAPILGANDGARLLQTASINYSDMRPHLALAGQLLAGIELWPLANGLTAWLPNSVQELVPAPAKTDVQIFDAGGYAILEKGAPRAVLRLPNYKFRPSHADALHTDIWHGDQCIITDAGTWSYAALGPGGDLTATSAHATATIDGRSQMPRLGRFLFGDWLKGSWETLNVHGQAGIVARYRDSWGATHERQVIVDPDSITIRDKITGAQKKMSINWPLVGNDWTKTRDGASSTLCTVSIHSPSAMEYSIRDGICSVAYLKAEKTTVLSATFTGPDCEIETCFTF